MSWLILSYNSIISFSELSQKSVVADNLLIPQKNPNRFLHCLKAVRNDSKQKLTETAWQLTPKE